MCGYPRMDHSWITRGQIRQMDAVNNYSSTGREHARGWTLAISSIRDFLSHRHLALRKSITSNDNLKLLCPNQVYRVDTVQFSASQIEDCKLFPFVAVEPTFGFKEKLQKFQRA